jgi:nitrous oxide reductase accessory protein NosL
MKLLKTVMLVVLLAVAGCKESADTLMAAHATQVTNNVQFQYAYSGVNIPNSAPRGQVFEYR